MIYSCFPMLWKYGITESGKLMQSVEDRESFPCDYERCTAKIDQLRICAPTNSVFV